MKKRNMPAVLLVTLAVMLAAAGCGNNHIEEENAESSEPVELVVTEEEEEPEAPAPEEEEEEPGKEEEAAEEPGSDDETPAEEQEEVTAEEKPQINWDDIEQLPAPVTMYVKSDKVNIRKGPDTAFDVVGRLAIGDTVKVIGKSKSSEWKRIEYSGEAAAFVRGDFLTEEPIDLEALKAEQEAAAKAAEEAAQQRQQEAEAAQQAQTQPAPAEPMQQAQTQPAPAEPVQQAQTQAAPAEAAVPEPAGILFIGDSRTCQMQTATQGANCSWICEYGTKYEWFEDTAVPKADKLIGQGTKVVICMGVNDPGSRNNYASLVNRKAGDWNARGAAVYYVSLNPTGQPYDDKNTAIDNFNASMPGLLSGVHWIDTASTVKQGGYVLVDGIHYDAVSNVNLFNLICGNL